MTFFPFDEGGGGGKRRHGHHGPKKQVDTAELRLIDMIVKLGDNLNVSTMETHIVDLIATLSDGSRQETVMDTVFRCVVALPVKAGIYASLLALTIVSSSSNLAETQSSALSLSGSSSNPSHQSTSPEEKSRQIFLRLRSELFNAFKSNDYYAIKFLLRFASELSNVKIISNTKLDELFQAVLSHSILNESPDLTCASVISSSDTHDTHSTRFVPQHVGDFYVTCIISAICLKQNWHPSQTLLDLISTHMKNRQTLSWLSPFLAESSDQNTSEGLHIANIETGDIDSLSRLYSHFLSDLDRSDSSPNRVILRPYQFPVIASKLNIVPTSDASNATDSHSTTESTKETNSITLDSSWTETIEWFDPEELATDRDLFELLTFRTYITSKNAVRSDLGLTPLIYPSAIDPCSFTNPIPMCNIFPPERTNGEGKFALQPLERWFVDDYSADIIHFFRSTHAEIPKHLSFCRHLTDFFDFDALLIELIFKDFLRVPSSPYPPVHHGVILLDMCQKTSSFQMTLAEATERLFGSLANLTSTATSSFVEWFSYHLSNVEFKWTWKEWSQQLQTAVANGANIESNRVYSAQLAFIQEVVSSIIRLSYYERIAPVLAAAAPESANSWLPEKPEPSVPSGLYASPLALSLQEEARNLQKPPEALLEPILALGTAVPVTSEQVIQLVVRSILVEGSSSITLLQATLSRFHHVLKQVAFTGLSNLEAPTDGAKHILAACYDYHASSPQHFIIVVLTLLHRRIIDANAVVNFLLEPEMIEKIGRKLFHWELITHAVRYVTQAKSVLEAEITNHWILSCKSNPNSDVKSLAEKTKERTFESQEHLSVFSTLLHPLMMTVFTSLIDLLSHPKFKSLIKDHFISIAVKHRHLILPLFSSLDILISALSPDLQSLYQNLNYLSVHY